MKILAILGPTATGKTDIALNLAKKLEGEIVSCDSRQVYRGLDIGTGKDPSSPPPYGGVALDDNSRLVILRELSNSRHKGYWIVNGIKIWMYDVVDPKEQYDVAKYIGDSTACIENIIKRKKLPIIVGGSGLYLRGLLEGFSNLQKATNPRLRNKLNKLALYELQEWFKKKSPEKWESMNNSDRNNRRRLVRAVELSMSKENGYSPEGLLKKYDVLKIGLTAPRIVLYKRIDARVISRIKQGMIKEAESLFKKGLSLSRMRELGLEYGILADYLEKKIDKKELIQVMQIKIHRYAKRQQTWFKKEKNVYWFYITQKNWDKKVDKLVSGWYNN